MVVDKAATLLELVFIWLNRVSASLKAATKLSISEEETISNM